MNKAEQALFELRHMDELQDMDSPVHRCSALIKLITVIVYIVTVVSFDKYDLSRLMVMVIFPVIFYALAGISLMTCFSKLKIVLPLVLAVGIFNPLLDRTVMLMIGPLKITGGWISMITLLLKGVMALTASFLLAATTRIDELCGALRRMHVPSIIVTVFLLTYRYITVLTEEVSIMTDEYHLRAPGQKGIAFRAWGSFLGQLLLRSADRAEELYSSMLLRGFSGEFRYVKTKKESGREILVCILLLILFILLRNFDLAEWIGKAVTG